MRLLRWIPQLLCLTLWLAPGAVRGQGSLADYQQADSFGARFRDKVLGQRVQTHWIDDGQSLWMRVPTGPGTHRYKLVTAANGRERDLFDHDRLAAALAAAGGDDFDAARLPLQGLQYLGDNQLSFRAGGTTWSCDLESYVLSAADPAAASPATTVVVLGRARPSRDTGDETNITFVNQTPAEIELAWIDANGRRHPYGAVPAGGERRQHTYAGHVWIALNGAGETLGAYRATDSPGAAVVDGSWRPRRADRRGAAERRGDLSPDGQWRVEIVDANVVLHSTRGAESIALSADGASDDPYLPRCYWSPDSARLVVLRERPVARRQVQFVESSPPDQLQPKLHAIDYPKPGDELPRTRVSLFDVANRRPIAVDHALFDNPWSLSDFAWRSDSSEFTFLYNQRGHQTLRLVGVNATTGQARALIDETSETFVCYSSKSFLHRLAGGTRAIWMSERDGWCHLYLYDLVAGRVINQITRGEWVVRGVERVDEERNQVWLTAGGVDPKQDPYHVHYCRVNLDGSGFVRLTEGDGTHAIAYAPNREYFIDVYSRVDLPPVTELRRSSDGALVATLYQADWSPLLAAGWQPPIRFSCPGRDGQTEIYGVIYRPSRFDPRRKYPIVESIYAGPHAAHVPKSFATAHRGQELAELGFVVVQIDGMGTSHRSKAFHDVCWRNLADAGFPDRVLWIQAAADQYPWMDAARVGVYGGSAGGQNALRALIDHGDFYAAAAADCGCHDNRM
ncbi:MAG: DPP IV N-terminal domain-containing protein, partial [Planctomycetales bacterium]|nr:DPP IV N-terminal domain-containing protein [Planctomycetales bacterium]